MSDGIELYPPTVVYVLLVDADDGYHAYSKIEGVFSSYEQARETAKTMALFDAYIEEYELR